MRPEYIRNFQQKIQKIFFSLYVVDTFINSADVYFHCGAIGFVTSYLTCPYAF